MKIATIIRGRSIPVCLLFSLLLGVGCGSKEEASTAGQEKPQVKVEITDSASPGESSGEGEDTSPQDEGEEVGNSENTPPEIKSLKLSPNLVYPGTVVSVLAEGYDKEGDLVSFFYRWKKNDDVMVDEVSEELDTSSLKKGDILTAFVTPYDGEIKGKEKMSPSVLVANRPPDITSAPMGKVADGVYTYQVEASDLDEDELSFSLESAPPGMTIDSSSGLIEWKLPAEGKGTIFVKVVVSDGDASAFQGFNLSFGK